MSSAKTTVWPRPFEGAAAAGAGAGAAIAEKGACVNGVLWRAKMEN